MSGNRWLTTTKPRRQDRPKLIVRSRNRQLRLPFAENVRGDAGCCNRNARISRWNFPMPMRRDRQADCQRTSGPVNVADGMAT